MINIYLLIIIIKYIHLHTNEYIKNKFIQNNIIKLNSVLNI